MSNVRDCTCRRWTTAPLMVLLGCIFWSAKFTFAAEEDTTRNTSAAPTDEANAEELAFFENKIRPVLVKACYKCHSTQGKKIQGGLHVDSRQGLMTGGDSGPAIEPGDAEASLLIDAIGYGPDSYQMPPSGKLPDEVIADFKRWIDQGAVDPRQSTAQPRTERQIDLEAGRSFWAFQPPADPTIPVVADADWQQSGIDRLIAARHEESGLEPVPRTDRRTLVRRLSFDLTGLPPSVDAVNSFLADSSSTAVEQLVDGLLASPQFGERWGRHWLDLARYADSNGSDINLTFPYAWRYRDYVIAAMNRDMPIDQFIREQVAGDLLSANTIEDERRQLIATGFLLIGPKMLSERDKEKLRLDVADEQVNTIGRALMGLTLSCARCHDHKFDPIPTTDYYALAGIFYNTETVSGIRMGNVNVSGWLERELPMSGEQAAAVAAYRQRSEELQREIKQIQDKLKNRGPTGQRATAELAGIVVDDSATQRVGEWIDSTYSPDYVGKGYIHDDKTGKGKKSATFTPDLPQDGQYEIRIAYTPGQGRHRRVPVDVRSADGEATVYLNQQRPPAIDNLFESIGKFRFVAGARGSVVIRTTGTDGAHVIVDAVQFLPAGEVSQESKPNRNGDEDALLRDQLSELKSDLKKLRKNPVRPAMAMAARDRKSIEDCDLRVRGEPHNRGKKIPRGFLRIASSTPQPALPDDESGRLELARWLTRPDHPLVARVYVNRLWQHLFGEGLVRTPDNFGLQGDRPSHPKLLDYLALEFIRDGWSTKRMIRRIVLSRTYQAASADSDKNLTIDPENRLLWRHNRRRLSGEALRDAMLKFSGQLDLSMGGSAVDGLGEQAISNSASQSGGIANENNVRRSIYLPLVRNDLPDFLDVFDLANPDVVTGRRATTNVPAQALLLMNSPVVLKHARLAAERIIQDKDGQKARITLAYQRALGRLPTPDETAAAEQFLQGLLSDTRNEDTLFAWAQLCQVLIASTEFRFVE